MRFKVTKNYHGRNGVLTPGEYRIPRDISLGDAKAARADGFGEIIQDAAPATEGAPAMGPAPFSGDGGAPETKEQRPASPFPTPRPARAGGGGGRKAK